MYKHQSTNRNVELLLPSGSEQGIKSMLPDAPPLSIEEVIQQEYEALTRAILMHENTVIKDSTKAQPRSKEVA